MKKPYLTLLLSALMGCTTSVVYAEHADAHVTEQDYLSDMPVVLSVTRLAQPLNETPGAVTIIDRDMIRKSGARELAEVLRLVPGFLVTQRNGANPIAVYHSALDLYGLRMQVYVDGRSVYSSFYLGDTHRGMQAVVLEDIERIEVLRGSNSAAYGANAFLGVVNIVTRHSADTQGGMVSLSSGDKGINDNVARVGWGTENASFRVTASRRADSGLAKLYDDTRLSQLHFRGDMKPNLQDEIRIHAGLMEGGFGEGLSPAASNPGNIERTIRWNDIYFHLNWRRDTGGGESTVAHITYEQDQVADSFQYATIPTVKIDASGKGDRIDLGIERTTVLGTESRLVWGGVLRRESTYSPGFFYTQNTFSAGRTQVFANWEWRPHAKWLFNVGGLYENHNIVGDSFAPRLMANFHLLPDHTLRAGVTHSTRAPGLYELRGDTRFFSGNTQADWTFRASGKVRPELLTTNEVGYFGRFNDIGLTVDVRGFVERMNDRVRFNGRTGTNVPNDAINIPGPRIQGYEYQFDWKPLADTRVLFSESQSRISEGRKEDALEAPHRVTTLALFQTIATDYDLGLIFHTSTPFSWSGDKGVLNTPRQLDARLAKRFRAGLIRGEAAFTVQAIGGGRQEYKPEYRFERRGFATLKLEF